MSTVSYRALSALGLACAWVGVPQHAVSMEMSAADLIAIDDAYLPIPSPGAAPAPDTFSQLSHQRQSSAHATPSASITTATAAPSSNDEPEDPSSAWLGLAGLAAMGFVARRHHKVSAPASRLPVSA